MSVRRLALFLLLPTVLLAGCASQTSRCYVTLDPAGQPTAEACETGPHLILRPLGETNAAYYVPPYVLGALRYEGFLKGAEAGLVAEGPATDGIDADPATSSETDDRWLGLRWPEAGGSSLPFAASVPFVPAWTSEINTSQGPSVAMPAALGPARAFVPPMMARHAEPPVSGGSAAVLNALEGMKPASSGGDGDEPQSSREGSLAGRLAEDIQPAGMDGKEPRLGAAAGDLAAAYAAGNAWRNADRVARPLSVAEVLALRLPERQTIDGEIRYRRPVSYAALDGVMLTDWPL